KLFVTATTEVRAQRRFKELQGRGIQTDFAAVLADMKERDARDMDRAAAPLKPASDAFILDTSAMDAEEAFKKAMEIIRSR
ncbi:MAG: cytidylate kinase, partial [Micavibrio aeruginosavorus]